MRSPMMSDESKLDAANILTTNGKIPLHHDHPVLKMSPTPSTSSAVHNHEIVQEELIEKKDVTLDYHECDRSFSPVRNNESAFSPIRNSDHAFSPVRNSDLSFSPVRNNERSFSPIRNNNNINNNERPYSPIRKCNKGFMNHIDFNREVSVITSSTQVISTSQVETYRQDVDSSLQTSIECDHINSNSQTSSQTFVETQTIRSNPFQYTDGIWTNYSDGIRANLSHLKMRRNTISNKLTTIPDEETKSSSNTSLNRKSLPPLSSNGATSPFYDVEAQQMSNNNRNTDGENNWGSCLGCNKEKELHLLYKELQLMKDKLQHFESELETKRKCHHHNHINLTSKESLLNECTNATPPRTENEDSDNENENEISSPTNTSPPHSLPLGRSNTLISQQQNISNKMRINIGGIVHETYRSTIKSIPDTRLTWLARNSARNSPEYNPLKDEFFFDRHPQVFSHILNYYRTGKLHVPYDVCGPLFEEELQFWGIDDNQVESCCWLNYRQHRDAQDIVKDFEGIESDNDGDNESEPDLSKYGFSIDQPGGETHQRTWYQKWQPYMLKLTEKPKSSKAAKALNYVSMGLITLSVILFCIETIKKYSTTLLVLEALNYVSMGLITLSVILFCIETIKSFKKYSTTLLVLEAICVTYFTIELIVRFTFCPNKIDFLKVVLNWIDLFASVPFFVNIFVGDKNVPFLQSIRVIRVFRIIKLSRHSIGLQILGHTLRASIRELLLLILFLVIGIIIFSSLLFFCEHEDPGTLFKDIPTTFWWAVITMTTVGYGDMVPKTVEGKIVGAFCSICGLLMIALPVPVIVNNFNLYYSHAQARLKLPKKRRNMLCGAANALRSSEFYDDKAENDVNSETGETSVPRIGLDTPVTQTSIAIEDEPPSTNREQLDNIQTRRIKRFSRRDSNTFVTKSITAPDLSVTSPRVRNGYALSKRRSLLPSVLPTIDSMPEVEQ